MYTLITAATSSEAYSLKNKLNSEHILMGDYLELPNVLVQFGKAVQLPNPKSPSYTHQMLALCLDWGIDTIYALREQEAQLLNNASQLFEEYDVNIKTIDDKI